MVLPLETGIIYGPLFSRRLGLSLGVNLLPATLKICSFDCIYCHYGLTDRDAVAQDSDFPDPEQVYLAVEKVLQGSERFDTLTFSGNGEPTLHPHFLEIITQVRHLRDRLRPGVTLSLYSNASTVNQPSIRQALHLFDNPILKLDAGDPLTFEKINRPLHGLGLDDIITGLKDVPDLIIQSLFVGGVVNNSNPRALHTWQAALADIRPEKVQLYSCDYPVPVEGVERILPYVLTRIASETETRVGVSVNPFWVD